MNQEPFSTDPVRLQAAEQLTLAFMAQGHEQHYAQQMAVMVITRADVDLLTAQLGRLLAWLQENHPDLHPQVVALVAETRAEFERRVQLG